MQLIGGVVALHGHGLAVDEPVQGKRALERLHLLDDLRHLAVRERLAVEPVDVRVVLVQDVRPVADKVGLGGVPEHPAGVVPTVLLEHADDVRFEIRFPLVDHGALLNEHLVEHGALDIAKQLQLTLMKGDEGVKCM